VAVRLFVWGADGGNGKFLSPRRAAMAADGPKNNNTENDIYPAATLPHEATLRRYISARSFPDGIWNLNDDGGKKNPLPSGRRTLPNKPSSHHSSHCPIDREKKYYYIYGERRARACGFNDVSAKLERGKTL